ncbi:MAG: hypothetical protein C0423_09530 [Methylibium sp.]|nr:hypothetical protein [Methylibium sp.]
MLQLLLGAAALAALPAHSTPGQTAEPMQDRICSNFLPGGDGCLGPGFNTPGVMAEARPLSWLVMAPREARKRLQALLDMAPSACLLNETALREALADPENTRLPVPQIAAAPACAAARQSLSSPAR